MKSALNLLILLFIVTNSGCSAAPQTTGRPVGNGYFLQTIVSRSPLMEEASVHAELLYQYDAARKVLVWPMVDDVVIHDKMCVFLGFLRDDRGFKGKRLFVFNPGGRPINITTQIFSAISSRSKNKVSATAMTSKITQTASGIEIMVNSTDASLKLDFSWGEIATIANRVQQSGITKKDILSGTTYVEESDSSARGE